MKNSIIEKTKTTFTTLGKEFGITNINASPKVLKVTISTGVGSVKDKKKVELIADRLAKITGQKVAKRGAKKSVAAFKTREGDLVGYQVTLRGKRMHAFLEKLVNIALPRTKDFRGLSPKIIDEMGNATVGIKEHSIFPEATDEELKDVFGFAIAVTTSSSDPKLTLAFLKHIGFPFKKA